MPLLQRLLHYSFTSLLAAAILMALLWPSSGLSAPAQLNDKVVHGALFATLSLVLWSEYSLRHPRSYWLRPLLLLTACLVSFAALSEALQHYLPQLGRSADWADFAADCLGIATATPLGLALLAWRKHVVSRIHTA